MRFSLMRPKAARSKLAVLTTTEDLTPEVLPSSSSRMPSGSKPVPTLMATEVWAYPDATSVTNIPKQRRTFLCIVTSLRQPDLTCFQAFLALRGPEVVGTLALSDKVIKHGVLSV